MTEENKRESNESSGSFQRDLDHLVTMEPIYDPIKDIQRDFSSEKPRTKTRLKNKKHKMAISLKALKKASKTQSLDMAAISLKIKKRTLLYYCRIFKITWKPIIDRTITPKGRIVTKEEILCLQKKCLQWEAARELNVSTKQLRGICIQLDIPRWLKPYETRKIIQSSKQMPNLQELLDMEREMSALKAREKLGLSEKEFIQVCQDAGMDHRWNHPKAKKAGGHLVRPPPIPKSPY